uniref:Uncharacterized protein n=1 Tax=Arundo donax TaxID=35708 RepID=A0A0A9BVS2_ARUDO
MPPGLGSACCWCSSRGGQGGHAHGWEEEEK